MNMTSEVRLDRIEHILEENAIQIKQISLKTDENAEHIKALVDAHMRIVMTLDRAVTDQQDLRAAQQKTEAMLQAFIRSLEKGGNGNQ